MYTITRKLAMVCLAVVFSVLVYGCGGGGNEQADNGMSDSPDDMMTHTVDTSMVTGQIDIPPEGITLEAGDSMDVGGANVLCELGGPPCMITADDGTVTSVGGMATAMNSTAEELKLALANLDVAVEALAVAETAKQTAVEALAVAETAKQTAEDNEADAVTAKETAETAKEVAETAKEVAETALADLEEAIEIVKTITVSLAKGYDKVEVGVYRFEAGETRPIGDGVEAECSGGDCIMIAKLVGDKADYTSLGEGKLEIRNTTAVTETLEAIALHSPDNPQTDDDDPIDILRIGNEDQTGAPTTIAIKRNTDGSETTIMLTHTGGNMDANAVKYKSGEAVDAIGDWSGQTRKRSDNEHLLTPQKATVYTNIDPATRQKLKLGDGDAARVSAPSATNVFVLDSGQDDDDTISMDESTFRVTYNGIPGTFTCAGDDCVDITTLTDDKTGQRIIDGTATTFEDDGWTFESDDYVETVATPDADYMYFGYWLQSPDPDDADTSYLFATVFGGRGSDDAEGFGEVTALTSRMGPEDEALTATYVGGAAGRYVTRKLRLEGDGVDFQSPGNHGSFTATATLTAHFGMHLDFDADLEAGTENRNNQIGGTITDFMDGTGTGLGFDVTLGLVGINDFGSAAPNAIGVTKATFDETMTSAEGVGTWNGNFYGPSFADLEAMAEAEDEMYTATTLDTTTPTGVAGEFNASSTYSTVVGAFAAERQ